MNLTDTEEALNRLKAKYGIELPKTDAEVAWDDMDVSENDIIEVDNPPMERLKNDVFEDW